jgi:hypothetical protein
MKRLFVVAAIVALSSGSRVIKGQEHGNPFIDHSDTGEVVHVLPAPAAVRSPRDTQPTDAVRTGKLTVYSASYGSGNLIDHGGHQIPMAGFYAIYWNSNVASSVRSQVNAFLQNFSDGQAYTQSDTSADYSIVQQYGSTDGISPILAFAGDFIDSKPAQGSFSDGKVRNYLTGLFNNHTVKVDPDTIYGVYFPSGMKISLQGGTSCAAFCGYHGNFAYNGQDIKYAVFPYPDCRGCSLPGKAVTDMLTIVTSHEIREAVTDPDLNAWFDAAGDEADDKCAWHNLYQTAKGGFWVQPEYSNGGGAYPGPGCVVPR